MSLKISNKATPKQIQALKDLDYVGKWDLTVDEAAQLLTELWEERRISLDADTYDLYDESNKFGD